MGWEEPPERIQAVFDEWAGEDMGDVFNFIYIPIFYPRLNKSVTPCTLIGSWGRSNDCIDEGWGNYIQGKIQKHSKLFFITSKEPGTQEMAREQDAMPHIDIVVYYLHEGEPRYYYACSGEDFYPNEEYFESIEICLKNLMHPEEGVVYSIYMLGQYDLSPHRGHWPFINWKINLLIGGGA